MEDINRILLEEIQKHLSILNNSENLNLLPPIMLYELHRVVHTAGSFVERVFSMSEVLDGYKP